MKNSSRLFLAVLLFSPLAAQEPASPTPAKADDVWFADFDKAVAAATAQKKDLLVDFTGSDWCGWCIKLHEEVFGHESFVQGAQKHFVLVALDFPHDPAIKAKVPNPTRNQELQQKYSIAGFPTVLLLTPAGEVFGKTGYAPGGPEKYLESLEDMVKTGKTRMAEVAALGASFEKAKEGKERDAIVAKAVTLLAGMKGDDVGVDKVAEVAKPALASTDAKVFEPAMKAFLKTGQADADVQAKALELDKDNKKGLYELAVRAKMETVQDDTMAKAFLADLDKVVEFGGQDKDTLTTMLVTAMHWSQGPLKDAEGAKKWATRLQKHIAGTEDEKRYGDMIKQVLGS